MTRRRAKAALVLVCLVWGVSFALIDSDDGPWLRWLFTPEGSRVSNPDPYSVPAAARTLSQAAATCSRSVSR